MHLPKTFLEVKRGITRTLIRASSCIALTLLVFFNQVAWGAEGLDASVSRFLYGHRNKWRDRNVSYEDGKVLYDLVVKGGFRQILEIGTSTGHSTIWLAWAAAKTGGRVTTIEIDRERYEEALENFRKAGVAAFIDARLADAHTLVPTLQGPFDFIFSDADKEWYLRYFTDLESKIAPGGCYTAHNVIRIYHPEVSKFLDYVKSRSGFHTTIERGGGEGISVSCRTGQRR
jgi:caffeoyl-CoA O-methyltransferase